MLREGPPRRNAGFDAILFSENFKTPRFAMLRGGRPCRNAGFGAIFFSNNCNAAAKGNVAFYDVFRRRALPKRRFRSAALSKTPVFTMFCERGPFRNAGFGDFCDFGASKNLGFYDVLGTRTLPKPAFRRLLKFRRLKTSCFSRHFFLKNASKPAFRRRARKNE